MVAPGFAMEPGLEGYRARPLVIGALGRRTLARVECIQALLPGLVTVVDEPDVLLLASTPIAPYRTAEDDRAWVFGDRVPRPGSDWQDAAVSVEASGLSLTPERAILHTGALGFLDIHLRWLDDTVWFSGRMEPLLALDDSPLEMDWEAWASILMLHYPVASATTFRAIRRLEPASCLTLDRTTGGVATGRFRPPWYGLPRVEPDAGDPGEVEATVREVMGTLDAASYAFALSGGFDTRLLSAVIHRLGIPVQAWSTDKDDGLDDRGIAAEIASLTGLPIRFVDPADRPYAENGDEVRRRTETSTCLHTWMGPLAAEVRRQPQVLITGAFGGAVLGNAHVSPGTADLPAGRDRLLSIFHTMSRPPHPGKTLSEQAVPWIAATALDAWLQAVAHLQDDPNEPTLAVLETREARGIANLTIDLFGPEVGLETPLVRPEVLRVALGAGLRRKVGGAFYREVLAVADPALAAIRTTNDPRSGQRRSGRLMASEQGLAWFRRDLERAQGAIPDLVPDALLRYFELGHWTGPRRRDRWLGRAERPRASAMGSPIMAAYARRALPVATLGWWIHANQHRLASVEPPWARRGRRSRLARIS